MSKEETEDYLMEDAELPSQKIVLLSFLSPEKVLANKDIFLFKKFLATYDLQLKTTKFEQWVAEQFRAANAKLETLATAATNEETSREDIAKAITFFLSELSPFVTGQTLAVDGGSLATNPFIPLAEGHIPSA